MTGGEGGQMAAPLEVGVVRSTSGDRIGSASPDSETHTRQMFLNAISRINSNNPKIGKDEKVIIILCVLR